MLGPVETCSTDSFGFFVDVTDLQAGPHRRYRGQTRGRMDCSGVQAEFDGWPSDSCEARPIFVGEPETRF